MIIKKDRQTKTAVALFIGVTVFMAVTRDNYLLATIVVITGVLFMMLARTKDKFRIDEREKTIREKASQMAYAIFAPTIGIAALLLLIISRIGPLIFFKANFSYVETLGIVFASLTLFIILIYTLSYYFINKKYAGNSHE